MPDPKKKKTTRKATSRSQFDKPKSKGKGSFSQLNTKWKALIVVLGVIFAVGITSIVIISQLADQPFVAGDTFSFQIDFKYGSGSSGNLQLYYYNASGLTDDQKGEIVTNDSKFVDFYEIPFGIDGIIDEIEVNDSFYYRYYVQPADYSGSYGYVIRGLNEIYVVLLPTTLAVDVSSPTFSHTLLNTTETNWSITYVQAQHGFNSWYNKTGLENMSWVFKFDFDVTAEESFVNVSWFSFENQNTFKTINGNSLYVEIKNFGYINQNTLNIKFFDQIGTIANVTRLGIGYGNANNFVELGSHS